MKTTIVEYTVRKDYVETNKANIRAVTDELAQKGDTGVQYFASLKDDGQSFVHVVISRDEEGSKVVPSLNAFKHFRTQLNTGLVSGPNSTNMDLVGKSFDL